MKKTPDYSGGEFRFPVVVQRPTYTPDDSGGQVTVWNDIIPEMFCAIDNAGGSEPYGDGSTGRIRTQQMFNFTTWWRDDIQQTDRLIYGGLSWNIRQINNLNLRIKFIQIKAEAGVEQ